MNIQARSVRIGLIIGLVVLLAVMFYFAALENSPLPYHPAVDGWNDLILHVGAFGLLTVIACLIMPLSWSLIVILFTIGCVMEFIQYFVPTREVDAWDVAANAFGVLLGVSAVLSVRWLSRRISIRHASLKE